MYYDKELQKINQAEFKRRNAYRLYVKWKSYDNAFNSWMDKKDIVT